MHVELADMTYWFHESVSCLHDCMAMVLLHYGQEPIAVLGARWCFFHDPAGVSQEEFYYPSATGSLGRDLAPYHDLRAGWRTAGTGDELLLQVIEALDAGRPVIVAEDNFHMPNRPAFHDVHAAHLVLLTGHDPADGVVQIMEPTPPLHRGPIARAQLLAAMASTNEVRARSRDYIFAGARLGLRWIDVEPFAPQPPAVAGAVVAMLERNLDDCTLRGVGAALTGIAGLETYLRELTSGRGRATNRRRLAELYTVGWAHQAQTALHAEFLQQYGRRFGSAQLLEAARRVDSLAAQWTALRLFGAHGAHGGIPVPAALSEIDRRIDPFIAGHLRAIAAIEQALPFVATGSRPSLPFRNGASP